MSEKQMELRFEKWWGESGRYIDPDTDDVPWFDKRKELCAVAFGVGVSIGFAQGGNYTADDAVNATKITFANGRVVRVVNDITPYRPSRLIVEPK